ncbi:NusA-like transcription termination signal-binding factor [Ignisphaera sp. 4213-co]|uniref:Probable transcription termination protein NusA n=1 Tax=Ignisphaera cupida TaxID=3050454 RepID=A0ABD4Z5E5_9CREN|nr:NusA-like transcription termination signal-binding factor [Ignisphaera sp. 4213-co]MDK6028541.1 NusA-like transcription termination signal-binding factor [Ignisphaera sp. 4213-co]
MAARINDIKPQFNVKLTMEEMRYMTIFQDVTGVTPKDCIVSDELNSIIFIVDGDKVGQAVGKKGYNVKYLAKLFGKNIDVVGWADNLEDFAKNIFIPARVYRVQLIESSERKSLYVYVDPKDKGIAIGRNGRNVAKAKILMKRYYNIDNVVIA